jgi:hypothetical protein
MYELLKLCGDELSKDEKKYIIKNRRQIIKGIYMGDTPNININVNTLYEGITILSHALIAMNTAMIEILLNKDADINAGDPSFLELLEFYAIIYKKQPSYKGPIDTETIEIINRLKGENDLLKQRIDELTAQLAIEKDPTNQQELNKKIDEFTEIINEKDNEIIKLNENARQAAERQTTATQGTTDLDVLLQNIYELYADYVLKNPFYEMEMPIRCDLFNRHLDKLITRMQQVQDKKKRGN